MEVSTKKLLGQRRPILLGCVGALLLSRVLVPTGPERLRDLPRRTRPLAVMGDTIVLASERTGVRSELLRGGRSRQLVPPLGVRATLAEVLLSDGKVLFRTEEPDGSAMPVEVVSDTSVGQRARLWQAAGDGTAARELLPHLRMARAVPSGQTCFWLKARPVRSVSRRYGQQVVREKVYESDLMATPREGGPARTIARAISSHLMLEPLAGGISWTVPWQGNPARHNVYFALPPRFEVRVLRDCTRRPELHNGRAYWVQTVYSSQGGAMPEECALVSAKLNGSDRRTVLDLRNNRVWDSYADILRVHAGHLYCVLYQRTRPNVLGPSPNHPVLCTLDEGGVRRVARMPPRRGGPGWSAFSGEYFYHTSLEVRENWFDWSSSGLRARHVAVLYRTRLPRDLRPPGSAQVSDPGGQKSAAQGSS